MKVYWDFQFEDVLFRTSGELSFDKKPYFIATSTILQPEEIKVTDKMLGMGLFTTQVVGVDGKKYSLYNCRITEVGHRMGPSFIIELTITFSMIIQESEANTKYIGCSFTFDRIEELFSLEPFESEFIHESKALSYKKPDSIKPYVHVCDDLQFKVESEFDGTLSGNKLFNLHINQSKRVFLKFDELHDIEFIISQITMIKHFFEMMYSQELHVGKISLEGNSHPERGSLIYSDFNIIHNPRANPPKVKFIGTYVDIVNGLIGWTSKYNLIKPGIEIWLKQFYNSYVGQSDIILWNCQTIEYLGACTESIKAAAQKIIGGNYKDPNIRAYLKAINSMYHFMADTSDTYYSDAKLVRDKITHNNPDKSVSARQLRNTEEITKVWSKRLIQKLIGLENVSWSMGLIPASESNRT